MIRKVLVMSRDGGQTCGVLSLEQNNSLFGRLRLFNIEEKDLVLSVKIGEHKLFFDNIENPENYEFSTVFHNLNAPICAVLASAKMGDVKLIASGHSENDFQSPASLFDDWSSDERLEELSKMIDEEIEKQDALDQIFEEEKAEQNISDGGVKVETYGQKDCFINTNSAQNEETECFLDLITPQLDELFKKFPHCTKLEDLIEDTEWIEVSNQQENYVMGKIFDEGQVTHLCYGTPAKSIKDLPEEHLREFCQWLPLDTENPEENGYWVMYQDATTGENVVLNSIEY
ncbi:MAG: hypothetical protein IJZ26_01405 [Clostridia bacterium]|nr:hypothetical protein [Clostridia bacterium]MBQ9786171.1 hypothetical protein [Clostridia bacterium]